jgi:hypothetical protein
MRSHSLSSKSIRSHWLAAIAFVLATMSHALADDDTALLSAMEQLPSESQVLRFTLGQADLPRGGHLQGIQMRHDREHNRQLVFLSHDSLTVGYLLVVELPADAASPGRVTHLLTFPSDGSSPPLRHAGGIQIAGDILAVGLEDNQQKTRSEVQFWNVSTPNAPVQLKHLTVRRAGDPEDQTAGAVALLRREQDYVLAVGNWDSRAIDFYATNGKPLDDTACRFALRSRWTAADADRAAWRPDKESAAYQSVNLAAGASGETLLVGFGTTPAGPNVADVFAVDLQQPTKFILRKVARKVIAFPPGTSFRNAGSLSLEGGRPAILASPRNLSAETRLGIVR